MAAVALLLSSNLEAFYLNVYARYQHLFNYSRILETIVNSAQIYTITRRHKGQCTLLLVGTSFTVSATAKTVYVSMFQPLDCKGLKVYIKLAFIAYIASVYCIGIEGIVEVRQEGLVKGGQRGLVKIVIVINQRQTITLVAKKANNTLLVITLYYANPSGRLASPTVYRLRACSLRTFVVVIIVRTIVFVGRCSRFSKLKARGTELVRCRFRPR